MKRDFEVADCMLQTYRTAVGSENNHRSFSQYTRIQAAGFDNQHRWFNSILTDIETNINHWYLSDPEHKMDLPLAIQIQLDNLKTASRFQMRTQLWLLEWDYCNICKTQNSALSIWHWICWGWIRGTNHLKYSLLRKCLIVLFLSSK